MSMPGPTSTASVRTPTPTPTAEPIPSAPAQVFGGDCDAVLTAAQAGEALGMPMSVMTAGDPKITPQEFAVRQLGGLDCGWAPTAAQTGARIAIVVLPAAFMEPTDTTKPYCYGSDSGTGWTASCSFNVEGSGFWLSGVASTPVGTTNEDARTAIAKLSAQFSLNAAAAPVFVPTPTAPGSWTDTTQTDCMADSEPLAAALAETGITAAPGNAAGELPHGFYRALGSAGTAACMWSREASTGRDDVFDTDILPGAAWVQTQLAALPGVTEVSVAGVERALLSNPDPALGRAPGLDIFDGPNWLHLDLHSMQEPVSYGPVAAALVAALNDAG